jgi:hypothetical protein
MSVFTDNRGRFIPFFVESFTYEHIATANFDPITLKSDATGSLTTSGIGKYSHNGFLVRPNADGLLYGITWRQYVDNNKSLTGLTPQAFLGSQNQWIECAFVKIYASNDGTYATVSTYINVAPI